MRLWLSKQASGLYMLTAMKPSRVQIMGTDKSDLYCRLGEPIGIRHLCERGVQELFNLKLKRLESKQVELRGFTFYE